MKRVLAFLCAVVMIATMCTFYMGEFTVNAALDGEGTAASPYVVTTAEDLISLAQATNVSGFASAYIELGADIDLNEGWTFTPSSDYTYIEVTDGNTTYYVGTGVGSLARGTVYDAVSGGSVVEPEGLTLFTPFNTLNTLTSESYGNAVVSFDGKGHTISGLFVINSKTAADAEAPYLFSYGTAGLFTNLSNGSVIKNLTLANGAVISVNNGAGAFAGRIWNSGTVQDCVNDGVTVVGNSKHLSTSASKYIGVGGIVGGVQPFCGRDIPTDTDGFNENYIIHNTNKAAVIVKADSGFDTDEGGIVGSLATGAQVKYNSNYGDIYNASAALYGVSGIVGGAQFGMVDSASGTNRPRNYPVMATFVQNANYGTINATGVASTNAYVNYVIGRLNMTWATGGNRSGNVTLQYNMNVGTATRGGAANTTFYKADGTPTTVAAINKGSTEPLAASNKLAWAQSYNATISKTTQADINSAMYDNNTIKGPTVLNKNNTLYDYIFWPDMDGSSDGYYELIDNRVTKITGNGSADAPFVLSTPEAFILFAETMSNYTHSDTPVTVNGKSVTNVNAAKVTGTAAATRTSAAKAFIQNANGLSSFDRAPQFSNIYVKLGADIDLSSGGTKYDWTAMASEICHTAVDGGSDITDPSFGFRGTFDGAGHTISGLNITNKYDGDASLFGNILGTVKNLKIANTTVTGVWQTGALASFACGTATETLILSNIEICADVTVTSTNSGKDTAGLIGYVQRGAINDCVNRANVTATNSFAGGIVGLSSASQTNNCVNYGNIKSNTMVGGIFGKFNDGTTSYSRALKNCVNYGNVEGAVLAGGITGEVGPYNTVTGCVNYGNVKVTSGSGCVGGIAGDMAATSNSKFNTVEKCANYGEITSTSAASTGAAGGIVGKMANGTNVVRYNLNEGKVTAKNPTAGIVARADNSANTVYGNVNASTEILKNGADVSVPNAIYDTLTGSAPAHCYTVGADDEALANGTAESDINVYANAVVMFQNIGSDEYPTPIKTDDNDDLVLCASVIPAAVDVSGKQFVGYIGNGKIYKAGQTLDAPVCVQPFAIDFYAGYGAGVRTVLPTGLRYQFYVSENDIAVLNLFDEYDDAAFGTMIVPTDYADQFNASESYGPFSAQALVNTPSVKRLDIPNSGWFEGDAVDGFKSYCGSVINVLEENYDKNFSSVGYLKVTYADGSVGYVSSCYETENSVVSTYNDDAKAANSRTIRNVAQAALADQSAGFSAKIIEVLEAIVG